MLHEKVRGYAADDLTLPTRPPQVVCSVVDGSESLGYLVVDSTVGGRSCGGLRLLPDVDEDEMRGLARAMTLKYGFLGLPQGGAKAGVRGDPEAPEPERRERLLAFSRAIAPLLCGRTYVPGADMGTNTDDVRFVLAAAGVKVRRRELRDSGQSGYYTALSVLAGARAAAAHLGFTLAGSTVAIEGFGKVGSSLAALMATAGAKVVAVSTSRGALFNSRGLDVPQLMRLAALVGSRLVETYEGAERIDNSALLELPVDMLCPCARHDSITFGNAARVTARAVCPGSNNPVTPEAEMVLFERGVLSLPDFVANCGGVLGGTMEFASVREEAIAAFMERKVGARSSWLLEEAGRLGLSPREVAVPFALRRFDLVRSQADHPNAGARLFGAGLELYRRGWIPRKAVASLSTTYFDRLLR
jgi:glutamate dehydrogenase (NAD(P)+)